MASSETHTDTTSAAPAGATSSEFMVLVFSRTEGYRHSSIPAGITAIQELAAASKDSPAPFSVHATEDAIVFNPSTLAQYRVIVFLQASGEFLDNKVQLDALCGFVRGGGGIVGVHCASTGLPSSEWYGSLIGSVFVDHPEPQQGKIVVEDRSHPAAWVGLDLTTRQTQKRPWFPSQDASALEFEWFDEWYNFSSNPRDRGVHVLMSVRETSYHGGTMGADHPIAWCQEFESARSFYTALGHFDEAFTDPSFMAQIQNAIVWTAGT